METFSRLGWCLRISVCEIMTTLQVRWTGVFGWKSSASLKRISCR